MSSSPGSPRSSAGSVRSDMDIPYPEPLSRLHRLSFSVEYPKPLHRTQKKNAGGRRGNRYRTQPVTFDEIKEVDEESYESEETQASVINSMSQTELRQNFYRFSKAIEESVNKKFEKKKQESESPCMEEYDQSSTNPIPTNEPERLAWIAKARLGSI